MVTLSRDHQLILGLLSSQGIASSKELQDITGKSQPTVSRLISELSSQVLVFGSARATRYGLPKSIRGFPAQHAVYWTSEDGRIHSIGKITLLANDVLHVESDLVSSTTTGELPWFLSPLKAQGFLGRLLAQRLEPQGLGANPEHWGLESILYGALQLHDAPGSISIGDPTSGSKHDILPIDPDGLAEGLDRMASDVAATLPAGSSAGGEQPKFLAALPGGRHVLVKFSPPLGAPFGDRWADLLSAEDLASKVLREHGVETANSTVVRTKTRAYLMSDRFDRVGARGRKHVVSVGDVHREFVADSYANWATTCQALAGQRRLTSEDAERAKLALQFGRLIGNTDMHSGNLGLFVRPEDMARGRFSLAPIYDMLPMRWRPNPMLGGLPDYQVFDLDPMSVDGPAAAPALAFWSTLTEHDGVSKGLRTLAAQVRDLLAQQMGSAATASSSAPTPSLRRPHRPK
ncbi:HipA domain-containing protein [Paucibacter soli]|uniref:HipA domain-containing protein n=1 Tax=Paucibacter soli TaxID=3133433 RepID=UPI0030965D50